VIDLHVVVGAGDVVGGDDAAGCVDVGAAADDAAVDGGVIAVERHAGDVHVVRLHADDGASGGRVGGDAGDGGLHERGGLAGGGGAAAKFRRDLGRITRLSAVGVADGRSGAAEPVAAEVLQVCGAGCGK